MRRSLEVECSVSSSAEHREDEGRKEDPIAIAAAECEDSAIPSDNVTTMEAVADVAKTGSTPPSLVVPEGWKAKPVVEGGTVQERLEVNEISAGRPIAPSPLPRIVREYPGGNTDVEEKDGGVEPDTNHLQQYLC